MIEFSMKMPLLFTLFRKGFVSFLNYTQFTHKRKEDPKKKGARLFNTDSHKIRRAGVSPVKLMELLFSRFSHY